jgi:hypothetical protein
MFAPKQNAFIKTGFRFANSKSTLEIQNKVKPNFTSSITSPDL